ncbi:MAG: glycosyltransferase [Erysipelotrichaceae bacterium]|nr:glycosyltransferase [Erysipelotrichaceae bacterium]
MSNLLTINVAIYNVEEYLPRCLDSLVNQTVNNYIVYAIDDGSTDPCGRIVDEYASRYPTKIVPMHKVNGGISDVRNYGIDKTYSDYIAFVDGDDYVEPDFVEKIMKQIDEHQPDILLFDFYQYHLEEDLREVTTMDVIADKDINIHSYKRLLAKCNNATWNKVYRTSLFKDNNIKFPDGYRHQDLGTTPKLLANAGKIRYLNQPLYDYIVDRPNNITTTIDRKIYHILDMAEEVVKYYRDNGLFDEFKEELYYLCSNNIASSLRKAIRLKDGYFAEKFIDDAFDFLEANFKGTRDRYHIRKDTGSIIYTKRNLCKFYYRYKNR